MRKAVELAEEGAEHPSLGEVVDEVDPRTEECHHEVGHSQVDDVIVGGVVQSFVAPHDVDDEEITAERHQNHDDIEENLNDHLWGRHFLEGSGVVQPTDVHHVCVQTPVVRAVVDQLGFTRGVC